MYMQAIRMAMNVLDYYDTDGYVPFLGFGAKLPPFFNTVSQCFAVNGNIFYPELVGIDNLMRAYVKCAEEVQFHGPSAFAPVVRFLTKMASHRPVTQDDQFYHIMVLVVNGHVSDMEATVEAVVAASDVPLSIIVIAVGEGDDAPGEFSNLEILDADDRPLIDVNGRKQTRDIVQFVPFRRFKDDY